MVTKDRRHPAAKRLGRLVQTLRGNMFQADLFADVKAALITHHPAFYKQHESEWPKNGRHWIGRLESGEVAKIIRHAEFIHALGIALNCTPQRQAQLYAAVGLDPLTTFDPVQRRMVQAIRGVEQRIMAHMEQLARTNWSNCSIVEPDDAMIREWLRDALAMALIELSSDEPND